MPRLFEELSHDPSNLLFLVNIHWWLTRLTQVRSRAIRWTMMVEMIRSPNTKRPMMVEIMVAAMTAMAPIEKPAIRH